MRDIWIISDTHFCHENILNFTNSATGKLIRGARFVDVEEMNEHMIERWNSVVKQGDIVYHLGDVVMGGGHEWFKKNWPRLHGSKRLVVGNHDDIKFLSSGSFFQKVVESRDFRDMGLLLTHRPQHLSQLWNYKKDCPMVNVHGHIHENPSPDGPYINVSVEAIDYTPVHIDTIAQQSKELLNV
jgi:calcineurin-like phosphoesterase family protein